MDFYTISTEMEKEGGNEMVNNDYKDDLKKEYQELKTRIMKLDKIIENYYMGVSTFEQKEYVIILEKQLSAMKDYIIFLRIRAKYESIDLSE